MPAELTINELTEAHLKTAVVGIASSGAGPITTNSYIRCLNAFLNWAHNEGHTATRLRIAKLKEPNLKPATLKPTNVHALMKWTPKRREHKRLQVLLLLILDCGLRISEALGLERSAVDWEDSTVRVFGKGRKERTLPVSKEMRRRLWQWLKSHAHELVFPNANGGRLKVRYVGHAMERCREAIGIPKGQRFSPHVLRHSMATSYLRAGGSVVMLQRILGHADLQTTMRYVHLQTEDLTAVHDRFSPLSQGK